MQGSDKAWPEMGVGKKSTDGELGQILSVSASLGTLVVCARLRPPGTKDLKIK